MKTLMSIITSPFKWIAGTKLSSAVVQLFKKLPWLLGVLAFVISLIIMFFNYGMM